MFQKIEHMSDVVDIINNYNEFGVHHNDNNTVVVCYAIAAKDTFLGDDRLTKQECRGITFHKDGQILARPLHKFFNVGENEASMPENIPWEKINRVSVKHDGSMITPYLLDGKLCCKTKRSHDGDHASDALAWLENRPNHKATVMFWLNAGYTPIFEWVNPGSPIVLTSYEEPELILTQVRHMVTGEYIDFTMPEHVKFAWPFNIAENRISDFMGDDGVVSWDKLRAAARETEGVEGWIIQTADGDMWKVKTDWYMSLHHVITFFRWRDLFNAVRAGTLDDLRASFVLADRDVGVIDFVESYIQHSIDSWLAETLKLVEEISNSGEMTDAERAKIFKNRRFFREAMRFKRREGSMSVSELREKIMDLYFKEMQSKVSYEVIPHEVMSNWGKHYNGIEKLMFR